VSAKLVSDNVFEWYLTLMVGIVAAAWFVYDLINLWRTRNLDRSDSAVRDKHFGYVMGLVIGVIGVAGALRFHGVI
jgi:hypothetical protein